jgi:hypothetical protein
MLPTPVAVAIFALATTAVLVFGLWSWRRLWRHPITDAYTRLVYQRGVRRFGVLLFVVLTLVVPFFEPGALDGATLASRRFWGDIVMRGVLNAPLCLWVGYWFGRTLAWTRGVRPDHR